MRIRLLVSYSLVVARKIHEARHSSLLIQVRASVALAAPINKAHCSMWKYNLIYDLDFAEATRLETAARFSELAARDDLAVIVVT